MKSRTHLLMGLAACLPLLAQEHDHNAATGPTSVILLPREVEMRLAVKFLPKPLHAAAAVMVLEKGACTRAKAGSNPFTCLVSRRGGLFYPVCFDEQGTRTILPAFVGDTVLSLQSQSRTAVVAKIAEGFANGKYVPPASPICSLP